MVEALNKIDYSDMRVRDKILISVKTRLQINSNYRNAIRRLTSYLILPTNSAVALRLTWKTSSEIWYAIGDKSTDWNYYSKRGLLASIYSATVLFWLSDSPDDKGDFPGTWEFLDRRVQDVLKIFSLPKRIGECASRIPFRIK